jgi:feruloyl esterase
VAIAFAGEAQASKCGSLTGAQFGTAIIVRATEVPGSGQPSGKVTPSSTLQPPKVPITYCRVEGVAKPSLDSDIGFEVWLPESGKWNGKYLGVGGGGLAGAMSTPSVAAAVEQGYASSTTDTGHKGNGTDAAWALGHPEKLTDFAWRAIHETAVASKAIIARYYEKGPDYSYFVGCSTGGRQALMSAQRFPDDYIGIVAGAPAAYMNQVMLTWVRTAQIDAGFPGGFPKAKLALLNRRIIEACGDGSGMLADNRECRFDAARIRCKGRGDASCLTDSEVELVQAMRRPVRDRNGQVIIPGLLPGTELGWNGGSNPIAEGILRYMIYDDPSLDWKSVEVEKAYEKAASLNALFQLGEEPDLTAFRAAGGKIIEYQGWDDLGVHAPWAIRYYEKIAKRQGGRDQAAAFYRLFMAPGMGHCRGGIGPDSIGAVPSAPSPVKDEKHDVIVALDRWVREGEAPSELIATKYLNPLDPSSGVKAQRIWCSYPLVSRYRGSGDPSLASSYRCDVGRNPADSFR